MESKKICFITLRNLYAITCLPKYRESFGNNKFDIIYWDRHDIEESCGADKHYRMMYKATNKASRWRKLKGYFKFINHARKIVKKNKYDKVILLPTQTGILLYPFLKKRYAKKYIIDIRDYTAENNKLFYRLQKKIIKNSGLAVITSPGFKKFLPKHDYIISHNTTHIPESVIKEYRNRERKKERIVISCIGGIRFYEQFKRVIDCFKNDDRYLLKFIGNGSEVLKEYCNQNNVNNVVLIGRFSPDKTLDYYMDTDIVMNLYGNNNPLLDYALSNKLYYAATLGIPILVSSKTYMEEVAVNNGFGFSFDLDNKTMVDKLFKYYHSIHWKSFYDNCDIFMGKVYEENNSFKHRVKAFLN